MKLARLLTSHSFSGLVLLLCVLWAPSVRAQTPATLENGYRNVFDIGPNTIVPPSGTGNVTPPVTGEDDYEAYINQGKNGTAFGGFAVQGYGTLKQHTALPAPAAVPVNYPTSETPANASPVQLRSSIIGRPLAVFSISYNFGGVIPPPEKIVNGETVTDFYRAEPLNARLKTTVEVTSGIETDRTVTDATSDDPDGTTVTTNGNVVTTVTVARNPDFYWSKHASKVYATQPGAIKIKWKESGSATSVEETYVIATSPDKSERTLYWTENGFNGPRVEIPAGRVNAVNIIYNSFVPKDVATPYEPWLAGRVDFEETDSTKQRYKTLYYENNLISAYNVEGRVFIEYLGNPRGNGSNEQKGYEIVNVVKEATPETRIVELGEIVGHDPVFGGAELDAKILTGLGISGTPYLHEHLSSGGTKRTLYAVRNTLPGVEVPGGIKQISNEALIYWMETAELDLQWPKQFIGYILEWPTLPQEESKYSIYARPDSTTTDPELTAVQLDSANNPALVFQDDPNNSEAKLEPGNKFHTVLTQSAPDNRSLLRFTRGEDIWFERVLSKLDTAFFNHAGTYTHIDSPSFVGGSAPLNVPDDFAGVGGSFDVIVTDPLTGVTYEQGTDYAIGKDSSDNDILIRHYDGTSPNLDSSFPGLDINGTIRTVVSQSDGKLVIGGDFTTVDGAARGSVARLHSDGSLDTSFQNTSTGNHVRALAIQPDGKIVIVGTFTSVNGNSRGRIARLNSDGTLDTLFQNPAANNWVRHVVLLPNGQLLVAGDFTHIDGQSRNRLVRLNSDGTLDASFSADVNSTVTYMGLQDDGKIVIVGLFTSVNSTTRNRIARVNSDGTLDTAYLAGSVGASNAVDTVTILSDGRAIIGGVFNGVNGTSRQHIARLNFDGTLDENFLASPLPGIHGLSVYSILEQPDGKLLIGGSFSKVNGVGRTNLARLNDDGSLDTSFQNSLAGADDDIFAVAPQQINGATVIGGAFTQLNGESHSRIARFDPAIARLPDNVTVTYTGAVAYADIGVRIEPRPDTSASDYDDILVGYVHHSPESPLPPYNVDAYINPFELGFDEAAKGSIIAVNALPGNDKIEVWWYKKSSPNATTASSIGGTYWPSFVQTYQTRWPASPDQIILASNEGSDDLNSLQATGTIYTQNDSTKPGYNPNEEHALMLNGRAWALRDDLNLSTSSDPYVLLQYTNADQRPSMRVFKVERGTFEYDAIAGKILQAPMPLPLLPPALLGDAARNLASYEVPGVVVDPHDLNADLDTTDAAFKHYQKFTWTDRKGNLWVYRGPHDGVATTPNIKMRYFYKTLPGFHFPGVAQPAAGTIVPYLRVGTPGNYALPTFHDPATPAATRTDQPLDINFKPKWPATAPELRVGETLTLAKLGLPSLRGQSSAEIIYQQSVALDTAQSVMAERKKSARLFDPTRAKTYALGGSGRLAKIPDSVKTSIFLGKTYFPNLPPHLSGRLYFDPAAGAQGSLIFKGTFMDEPVGEKYLQLNVMSSADKEAAKDLVSSEADDKDAWHDAIEGLASTMETFIEDPAKRGTYIPLVTEGGDKHRPFPVINGNEFEIPADTAPLVDSSREPVGPEEPAEVYYSDTAVDSYALSASGGGQGYVVLAVGDGRNADVTPVDQPVSLQVFRVNAPLYRGELKVINSANPLDEKLTLQHTGDFAGHPEDYDFEWRYAPPIDGLPPILYSFERKLIDGNFSGNNWVLINNPESNPLNAGLDYKRFRTPGVNVSGLPVVSLPGQPFSINDGNGTAAHGVSLPHALLRREFTTTGRPLRMFLSIDPGANDGVVVYLNGAPVVNWNAPGFVNTATGTPPATAPAFEPLSRVFEIDSNTLIPNATNVFTVELYTSADAESTTTFNLRLEGSFEVESLTGWLPVALNTPDETASPLSTQNVAATPTTTGIQAVRGKSRHTIQGSSILTLSDNWLIMRYRARETDNAAHAANGGWSKWTEPQLAEGWIKRVLAGINPFQQRVKDLFNHETNTSVSLVEQAGKRWEGDIALNLENINDSGLIEIYETVLRRGKDLSITGTPAINYGGANDALLLAAGYLSDLYMILGNEAYADAANSTIAFSTDSSANFITQYGDVATALFSFKGQLATVLDEELALLRGRDDFLLPGTQKTPVYNRLIWNYTRGIDSGEAVYALNYNIKDREWDFSINPNNPTGLPTDGIISAADAAVSYPQGHGDAYGHYLTALTGYYTLLNNPNFTWTPRIEAVLVLGTPVSVDYQDERKFAAAAAAVARTASRTLDLTYRQDYSADSDTGWSRLDDDKQNTNTGRIRHFGTDDWASRGGQGALFHWVTANSLLPAIDPNPNHSGIQKIDRTTVPELAEIAAQASKIQQTLDYADAQVNPLGLAGDALAFDISPSEVDAGNTHYEQIFDRAVGALKNAADAFNNAKGSTQFLRQQDDTLADQRFAIEQQETAFTNQLVEIYGTPYADDIGPGKTYAQDYAGPDLLHSMYVDLPELFYNPSEAVQKTYALPLDPKFADSEKNALDSSMFIPGATVPYTLNAKGDVVKPDNWTGRRAAPGRMQTAVSNVLLARQTLKHALDSYNDLIKFTNQHVALYESAVKSRADIETAGEKRTKEIAALAAAKAAAQAARLSIAAAFRVAGFLTDTAVIAIPSIAGTAVDIGAPAKASANAVRTGKAFSTTAADQAQAAIIGGIETAIERLNFAHEASLADTEFEVGNNQLLYDLHTALEELKNGTVSVDTALRQIDQTQRDLYALQAEGNRIQQQRLVFRQHTAAIIQGYRTRDFAFRAFRDEALERYNALFELAARYTYLTARAYDYETGLLDADGNTSASAFYEKIVQSRALGLISPDGQPQFAGAGTGDSGLSGVLAELTGDWSVAKTRLGFNNPDNYRTTFSLRQENSRIIPGAEGDGAWKDLLNSKVLDNILDDSDVRRHAMQANNESAFAVPGIVLEFSTQIAAGYNFFGKPLAAGDHSFSPTSFATKIRNSGVAFQGYIGMDDPTSIGGAIGGIGGESPDDPNLGFNDPNGLSATPYIYLIPAGTDMMRSPPLGETNTLRAWTVQDQAIPLPFNIANSDYSTQPAWVTAASLSEPAFTLRKHQAFRAVPDGTVFSSAPGFTNSRLIGRSVWNTRWKIVIPGNTLLNNPQQGLQIFLDTVKDIKLHFETYSYSGN